MQLKKEIPYIYNSVKKIKMNTVTPEIRLVYSYATI